MSSPTLAKQAQNLLLQHPQLLQMYLYCLLKLLKRKMVKGLQIPQICRMRSWM